MSPLDPPPRRRILFMLTPLVDVMFLLLIFFMLSSQTAPYALLSILTGGNSQPAEAASSSRDGEATSPQGREDAVVAIGRGYVRLNGERVDMSDLARALSRFKDAGYSTAVVFSTEPATVQDVVSVLEAFQGSEFGEMRLVIQADGAP